MLKLLTIICCAEWSLWKVKSAVIITSRHTHCAHFQFSRFVRIFFSLLPLQEAHELRHIGFGRKWRKKMLSQGAKKEEGRPDFVKQENKCYKTRKSFGSVRIGSLYSERRAIRVHKGHPSFLYFCVWSLVNGGSMIKAYLWVLLLLQLLNLLLLLDIQYNFMLFHVRTEFSSEHDKSLLVCFQQMTRNQDAKGICCREEKILKWMAGCKKWCFSDLLLENIM